MTVTARYHHAIEDELEAWIRQLPGTEPERRQLAKVNLEAYRQLLIKMQGKPDGAVEAAVWPRTVLWEFEKGWWFACAIRDQKPWLRTIRREVLIFRCLRSKITPKFP